MSARLTTTLDETIRTIQMDIVGAQPLESLAGPKFDPSQLTFVIKNGVFSHLSVFGPQYRRDGKLGSKQVKLNIWRADAAPQWIKDIVTEAAVEWPHATA